MLFNVNVKSLLLYRLLSVFNYCLNMHIDVNNSIQYAALATDLSTTQPRSAQAHPAVGWTIENTVLYTFIISPSEFNLHRTEVKTAHWRYCTVVNNVLRVTNVPHQGQHQHSCRQSSPSNFHRPVPRPNRFQPALGAHWSFHMP
jgi:hypothetical protein